MEFLIYLITTIFVFLGIILGYFLSKLAFEELSYITKFVFYANIFVITGFVFTLFFPLSLIYASIISSVLLILLIIFRNKYHTTTIYAASGAIFYASSIDVLNKTDKLFIVVSALIFLYGVFCSTIFCYDYFNKKKINLKNHDKKLKNKNINWQLISGLIKNYFYFIAVALIFYLIFNVLIIT